MELEFKFQYSIMSSGGGFVIRFRREAECPGHPYRRYNLHKWRCSEYTAWDGLWVSKVIQLEIWSNFKVSVENCKDIREAYDYIPRFGACPETSYEEFLLMEMRAHQLLQFYGERKRIYRQIIQTPNILSNIFPTEILSVIADLIYHTMRPVYVKSLQTAELKHILPVLDSYMSYKNCKSDKLCPTCLKGRKRCKCK